MSVPSITLSGPALIGVDPPPMPQHVMRGLLATPQKAYLGRISAPMRPDVPHFSAFHNPPKSWVPPASVDWSLKAAASISQTLGNTQQGDCVIADRIHALGLWTANDSDSGGEVVGNDAEALSEYHALCGPGDNGCEIQSVLDQLMTRGVRVNGRMYKIAGYAQIDPRNYDLVCAASAIMGTVCLGINFMAAWQNKAVWDVCAINSLGGHDVGSCSHDGSMLKIMSWGRKYGYTKAVVTDPRFTEQCFVVFSENWTNNDRLAPSGFNVDACQAAIAAFRQGRMPDGPTPVPPVPPSPPTPPTPVPPILWPTFDFVGAVGTAGDVKGTLAPRAVADQGDVHELVYQPEHMRLWDTFLTWLWSAFGVEGSLLRSKLTIRRGKLTPEQWAAIIQLIAQVAAAIAAILAGK